MSAKWNLRDVIEILFLPVLTAAVFVLWDLNKSVGALNVQVGVLIANQANYDKRIDGLEKRMDKCEARFEGLQLQKGAQ